MVGERASNFDTEDDLAVSSFALNAVPAGRGR